MTARRPEHQRMSTILPRGVTLRIERTIERRLPLRWWDALNHFRVQTRLIFSRSILLMTAALLGFFAWIAIVENIDSEDEAAEYLRILTVVLTIVLNMNLWAAEREGRTFELLVMRIPSVRQLVWYKLRYSLFWLLILALPFYAALGWFLDLSPAHLFAYWAFWTSSALLVTLLTCVVASFVNHSLTTGIITFVLTMITIAFLDNARLPWIEYYRLFGSPRPRLPGGQEFAWMPWRAMLINRLVLAAAIACAYLWLRQRLEKIEKWTG